VLFGQSDTLVEITVLKEDVIEHDGNLLRSPEPTVHNSHALVMTRNCRRGIMQMYGLIAALDEEGRPSFNLLQSYPSSEAALVFFIFDVLILRGRNMVTGP
jgi:hypothetical protein